MPDITCRTTGLDGDGLGFGMAVRIPVSAVDALGGDGCGDADSVMTGSVMTAPGITAPGITASVVMESSGDDQR